MTDERIPVAVAGAGNMGANHLRVYDELPGANLVEAVEPNPDRAAEIRDQYDIDVYEDPTALTAARAATISVPNDQHRAVAETCIERGLDVLVEKPLATDAADAEAIIETAAANDAILQVGHVERYNPAVQTLQEILGEQDIVAVEARRLGPFNEHLSEESVIYDLMIHDLDIVEWLVESELEDVHAMGSAAKSDTLDHAVTQLRFADETLATLTASHITHAKIRELAIITGEAYLTVDYQKQDIVVQRVGSQQVTRLLDKGGYRTETVTESPYVRNREPLKNEIEHFLRCVRTREQPLTDGRVGVRAVERAERVLSEI